MMKVAPASPATKEAYADIVASLGADDSTMFGMPTMKVEGKAFAGIFGDEMVFKLTGDAHAGALRVKGARLFDPSGMGRAMKEWVVVPKSAAKEWVKLAASALEYVASAPAKPKKPAPKAKAAAPKPAPPKPAPPKSAPSRKKTAAKKRSA